MIQHSRQGAGLATATVRVQRNHVRGVGGQISAYFRRAIEDLCGGRAYVDPNGYSTGLLHNDDWSMYTGFQDDIAASTYYDPIEDIANLPLQDTPGATLDEIFGSAYSWRL